MQLGEILIRKGRLGRAELNRAVVEAAAAGRRLGEFLVEQNLLYEEDIAQALAEQFGLRYVSIEPRALSRDLASLLPYAVAQRLTVVPLNQANGICVAVADPTDVLAADELRMALPPGPTELVVSERSVILAGIAQIYSEVALWGGDEVVGADVGVPPPETRIDAVSEPESSAPAIELVNALLRRALTARASDLHFVPRRDDLLVRARVDGVMQDLDVVPLGMRPAVIARLKVMGSLDIAERRLPQDGRVSISLSDSEMDLRIAVLPTVWGEEAVLRLAYLGRDQPRTLADVGLDDASGEVLSAALHHPSGAILVAAPTGAGKTSTLYAALADLHDGTRSIVTIEDPVEASIDGIAQVEVNARVGVTFARGLRTILRADPDVILIGEIRDVETAEIALQAAITGHLVLSTLHAESATAALVRLRDLGIAEATIGSAVRCVVSQRLFRRPCARCGTAAVAPPEVARRAGFGPTDELFRPVGCAACGHTGYTGRVAAFEVLPVTGAVRRAISSPADIERVAGEEGMATLYDNARALVVAGLTSVDELLRVCGSQVRAVETGASVRHIHPTALAG
jgi:type IV pilus assembly protein PilB